MDKNKQHIVPVVWYLYIVQFDTKTVINGVLLSEYPHYSKSKNKVHNFRNVVKTYLTPVFAHKKIKLNINGQSFEVSTDKNGAFIIYTDFFVDEVEDNIDFKVEVFSNSNIVKFINKPIIFNYSSCLMGVISDIDDTILVSYTDSLLKRIRTITLTKPNKRKGVNFTNELLRLLKQRRASIFYVSKSEYNLFEILSTAINTLNIPHGVMLLTPYLSLNALLKNKKGKNFKVSSIKKIIELSGARKFVLLGDDTQKDMAVYTEIVKDFPNNISRIYIRQTKLKWTSKKHKLWNSLIEVFPNAVLFNNETSVSEELKLIE